MAITILLENTVEDWPLARVKPGLWSFKKDLKTLDATCAHREAEVIVTLHNRFFAVKPRDAESPVFHALRRLLGSAVKLRQRGSKLYVYGAVSREGLEEALEQARREARAELERRFRFIRKQKLLEALGFAPNEGVVVWEDELKGGRAKEERSDSFQASS